MTLYINLLSVDGLTSNKGKIYIEGSQAGALVAPYKSKNHIWDEPFEIHCSKNDQLIFKICGMGETFKDQPLIAIAKLHSSSLIKNYGSKLNTETAFRYHIDARTEDEREAGTIKLDILYDKTQYYMGQINGIQEMQRKGASYIPFYKGKCQRKNLFSMLDGKADGQEESMKFVESIYRDD